MNKWIAEFDLEDGDRMPEHMDLEYHGVKLDFHCRPLEQEPCEDAVSVTSVFEIMGNLLSIPYDFDRSITEKDVSESMDKIRELPRVTPQEPNTWSLDDAREDFMHDVYNELDFLPTNEEANRIIDIFDRVTSSIEQAPRKGHWVKEESIFGWDGYSYQCSECGRSIHLDTEMEDLEDYPYCHCGAKMQEVKE